MSAEGGSEGRLGLRARRSLPGVARGLSIGSAAGMWPRLVILSDRRGPRNPEPEVEVSGEWQIRIDGRVQGPMNYDKAKVYARENPDAEAWWPGLADWTLVSAIPELARKYRGPAPAQPPVASAPGVPLGASGGPSSSAPAPASRDVTSSQASRGFGTSAHTEGIDYRILGAERQFVEVELDPGESVVAEAGAMMYKDASVKMETVFGDGSDQKGRSGFWGSLLGAGQRLLTGESLFTTVFTQEGGAKARVAFGAPYPGNILALNLSDYDGRLIVQKDSFLAAAKGVSIGIHFQRKILTGLFGGEGFIMQKLEGHGWVFVHMGGTLHQIQLEPGQELHIDTGCVAAFSSSVDFDIQQAGGIKTMLFGGEGLFFARLRGPGHVWLQSLPFSRLAGRMLAAAPSSGGHRGEGSLLGGLGNLLDGDNRW